MIEMTKTETHTNKIYPKTFTEHKISICTVEELRNFLNDLIRQGLSTMKVSICGCSDGAYIHNMNNEILLFEIDEMDKIL